MTSSTRRFELRGVNHLALVCRDMERTGDFYTNALGMPLVKTIELPADTGQHFFFDCGGGDCLAFFWFPNVPIVGMLATCDSDGYSLQGSDGDILTFGDAPFLDSMGGLHLNGPMVGIAGV